MGKKIYVGNISFNATEEDLKGLFGEYGETESVKLVTDAQTGRPRGFGFVEMTTEEDAQRAVSALNGKVFMGRTLTVSEARAQQPRERGSFDRGGYRGGRGGYGGRGSGGDSR
jgi:RNA recognition motif-containing protein